MNMHGEWEAFSAGGDSGQANIVGQAYEFHPYLLIPFVACLIVYKKLSLRCSRLIANGADLHGTTRIDGACILVTPCARPALVTQTRARRGLDTKQTVVWNTSKAVGVCIIPSLTIDTRLTIGIVSATIKTPEETRHCWLVGDDQRGGAANRLLPPRSRRCLQACWPQNRSAWLVVQAVIVALHASHVNSRARLHPKTAPVPGGSRVRRTGNRSATQNDKVTVNVIVFLVAFVRRTIMDQETGLLCAVYAISMCVIRVRK